MPPDAMCSISTSRRSGRSSGSRPPAIISLRIWSWVLRRVCRFRRGSYRTNLANRTNLRRSTDELHHEEGTVAADVAAGARRINGAADARFHAAGFEGGEGCPAPRRLRLCLAWRDLRSMETGEDRARFRTDPEPEAARESSRTIQRPDGSFASRSGYERRRQRRSYARVGGMAYGCPCL